MRHIGKEVTFHTIGSLRLFFCQFRRFQCFDKVSVFFRNHSIQSYRHQPCHSNYNISDCSLRNQMIICLSPAHMQPQPTIEQGKSDTPQSGCHNCLGQLRITEYDCNKNRQTEQRQCITEHEMYCSCYCNQKHHGKSRNVIQYPLILCKMSLQSALQYNCTYIQYSR